MLHNVRLTQRTNSLKFHLQKPQNQSINHSYKISHVEPLIIDQFPINSPTYYQTKVQQPKDQSIHIFYHSQFIQTPIQFNKRSTTRTSPCQTTHINISQTLLSYN
ncbi:hypothetical protein V8G54_021780 [Vigna mungo]|uniref:Uncharacterized protein n=1 Tax=Vigna mungo TaxID=3915 RepID=A0AAQ3RXP1_VIGMU